MCAHVLLNLNKLGLVLVQPRKTVPFITERLLMEHKESNQTNQTNKTSWGKDIKCKACRVFYLFFATSDKFNNTRAQMLYSNYHVTLGLL